MIWNTLRAQMPRIIGHRGASGYRPENTLDSFLLAAAQGADAIEPDVVMSRDGVLFVRHDLGLAESTDIATRPEFASRARAIAGRHDWWVSDFDAAEIDTLRARQPFASRGTQFDGRFIVPRFSQLLDVVAEASRQRGTPLIVDIEMKHPEYFHALGHNLPNAIAAELFMRGLAGLNSPVWLESFDHAALRVLAARCSNAAYALFDVAPTLAQLDELAGWAHGIAPMKFLLWDAQGRDSGLIDAAHARGLEVHAWTFREDRSPAPFASTREELATALCAGCDAVFCDFPDVALALRAELSAQP
jgi:glycerophosphoryl diester phosphodiesterase